MKTIDRLAAGAWVVVAGAAAALSAGLLSWKTLEAGNLCLFKIFLGITCPGCGMGHALLHAFQGEWGESFRHHPLGIAVLAIWTFWMIWGASNLRAGRPFSQGFPVRSLLAKPLPAALCLAALLSAYAVKLTYLV